MAIFKSGTVAPPLHIVKSSPHIVLDASRSWQGPFERVHVKLLPTNRRCIETVCSWLGAELALPLPEARLLKMLRSRMPRGLQWPFGKEEEAIVFGTVTIAGARPLVRLDSAAISNKIDKWPLLDLAAVFDYLIANDDRTEGNILLAPDGKMWLIDHARALGGGGDALFSTDPMIISFFLSRIAKLSLPERIKRRPALISCCSRVASLVPRIPYDGLEIPEPIRTQIHNFLSARAERLLPLVLNEVGIPELGEDSDEARQRQ